MSEKSVLAARRRLLQKIVVSGAVAGGGLQLKSWSSPVVQSVLLPAHARASDPTLLSVTDPCFLIVNCINSGTQVQAQAGGQVVGPPGSVGGLPINVTLRLMNGNSVVSTAGPYNTVTASNGAWGPLPGSPAVFDASLGNAIEGVVSSPEATFTPDTCRLPFQCGGPPSGECSSVWDKSSLAFNGGSMIVCNGQDAEPSLCETRYEIWRSTSGNPKDGSMVASGTIAPLGDGCHDFLSEVLALCTSLSGGRFKVKAYQHENHPGTGELWSDTYICGSGFES